MQTGKRRSTLMLLPSKATGSSPCPVTPHMLRGAGEREKNNRSVSHPPLLTNNLLSAYLLITNGWQHSGTYLQTRVEAMRLADDPGTVMDCPKCNGLLALERHSD